MSRLSGLAHLDARKGGDLHAAMKTKTMILGLAAICAFNITARADQPHMRRALEHLRAARAELQAAEHDKGGWRHRAVENTDRAIAETERGMEFDRRH